MIPFSPPRIDQKIIDAVTESLQSGWITTGPRTRLFEERLSTFAGVPKVAAVNSATAGLELSLRWFGVGPGDEVIVPAYTYCATANVVIHCGARPVMIDSGRDFNLDTEKLAQLITPQTKAIIPVDFGGWPCNYDRLREVITANQNKFKSNSPEQEKLGRILLLADAAHSLGARYGNKMAAACADISVFSFHAVKNLTTAEGGAIAINLPGTFDPEKIYRYFSVQALHGQSRDALSKFTGGGWEYDVLAPGYKCNMPDILAAIGLVELERYENDTLLKRSELFNGYLEFFKGKNWAELPQGENASGRSSFHLFPLRILGINESGRNKILREVMDDGVSVNVHFKPLPMMSYYKSAGYRIEDFPVAFDNYQREISLPLYYDLTGAQLSEVARKVSNRVESRTGI